MFNHGVAMHYKRNKRHTSKIIKSRELNSSLMGWSYGAGIAKEVVLRKEFKKFKRAALNKF